MTELATQLLLIHQESFHDLALLFPELNIVNSLADKNNWIQIADSLGMPVSKTWNVNIQKIAILQAGGFTLSICTHTRKNHCFLSGAHVVPDTGPAKLVLMHADYRNSLFLI